eukprot:NODE_744_length_4265_cov_0.973116.p1 type:complete len:621 gc:universal NODE_744_length_4265_cov_0.973116:1655-3517(+)
MLFLILLILRAMTPEERRFKSHTQQRGTPAKQSPHSAQNAETLNTLALKQLYERYKSELNGHPTSDIHDKIQQLLDFQREKRSSLHGEHLKRLDREFNALNPFIVRDLKSKINSMYNQYKGDLSNLDMSERISYLQHQKLSEEENKIIEKYNQISKNDKFQLKPQIGSVANQQEMPREQHFFDEHPSELTAESISEINDLYERYKGNKILSVISSDSNLDTKITQLQKLREYFEHEFDQDPAELAIIKKEFEIVDRINQNKEIQINDLYEAEKIHLVGEKDPQNIQERLAQLLDYEAYLKKKFADDSVRIKNIDKKFKPVHDFVKSSGYLEAINARVRVLPKQASFKRLFKLYGIPESAEERSAIIQLKLKELELRKKYSGKPFKIKRISQRFQALDDYIKEKKLEHFVLDTNKKIETVKNEENKKEKEKQEKPPNLIQRLKSKMGFRPSTSSLLQVNFDFAHFNPENTIQINNGLEEKNRLLKSAKSQYQRKLIEEWFYPITQAAKNNGGSDKLLNQANEFKNPTRIRNFLDFFKNRKFNKLQNQISDLRSNIQGSEAEIERQHHDFLQHAEKSINYEDSITFMKNQRELYENFAKDQISTPPNTPRNDAVPREVPLRP